MTPRERQRRVRDRAIRFLTEAFCRCLIGALVALLCAWALPCPPLGAQVESAAAQAEAWLLGQQAGNGSFGAAAPLAPRDTAAVVEALLGRGESGSVVERGLIFLAGAPETAAEFQARRIAALARAGRPVDGLLASLLELRDVGGGSGETGVGAFGAHGANLADTAFAVQALAVSEESHLLDLSPLLDYLQAHQNADGGWGYVPGDRSRTYFTAETLLALASLDRLAIAPEVTGAAASFLVSRQQSDGSFGSSLETAVAYRALLASGFDVSTLTASPVDVLLARQTADGSWDGDLLTTSEAVLALGGEQPNLVVTMLSASPETVLPGESTVLSATVVNRGPVAAGASTLTVVDGAGTELASVNLPALAAGEEHLAEATVATDGATGELVLTVTADGRSEVEEGNEEDNSRTVRVAIRNEPDLAVYSSDLSIDPPRPAPGEPATLRVSVRNQGGTAVELFSYRVSELIAGAPTVLNEGSAGPAAPGTGTLVETPLDLPEGEHLLRVEIDPDGSVAESDETDNVAEIAYFVVDDTLPDLAVAPADVSAVPERPAIGEAVTVGVTVRDVRDQAAAGPTGGTTADVALYDGDPETGGRLVHIEPVTVPAGGSAQLSASFTADAATRFVTVVVDPADAVAELSEVNNRASKVLVDLPDLAVGFDNLELSPKGPLEGDSVHGLVTVRNAGTSPSPEASVEVWDGDPAAGGARITIGALPALPPGANASVDFNWTASGGLHALVAVVDPDDAVAEISENDNRTVREIAVPRSSGPDLSVGSVDLSSFEQDPSTLAAAGSVTVDVVNSGDAAATASVLRLFEDRDGDGRMGSADLALGSASVPEIGPGESVPVTVPVDATLTFRHPLVWIEVDATDLVPERREDDNRLSLFGDCSAGASSPSFEAIEEWSVPGIEVESAPVVVQLSDDNGDGAIDSRDVPDVVFHTEDAEGRAITARSGLGGGALWTVRSSAANPLAGRLANLAAADLDGDGVAEVIGVRSDHRLIALDHLGRTLWVSDPVESAGSRDWAGAPAVGDLDGDGTPEIAVGRSVLSSTGRLIAQGTANVGRNRNYYGPFGVPYLIDAPLSVIADVDLDGRAELVAGDALYRLEGGTLQVVWDRAVPDHLMEDGFVAVGNLDGDPYAEIVYVSSNQIMVLNHDGSVAAARRFVQPYVPLGNRSFWAGPPALGDLDGDGTPEILVSASNELIAFRANLATFWRKPTTELSEMAGAVPFDLDGDGADEVLYQDQADFRILDGATGETLSSRPSTSKTATELPVVADVDGDGRAEILVPSNRSFGGDASTQGLHVLGHPSWRGTRPIWNQHTFRGTDVLLDGTVPAAGSATLAPAGRFRSNLELPVPERFLPNLTAGLPRVGRASGEGVPVVVRVGNGGRETVPAGVRVVLYDADPAAGGVPTGEAATTAPLPAGAWEDVEVLWQAPGEAGITAWAAVDPDGVTPECDEGDNDLSFVMEESVLPDVTVPAAGVSVAGAPIAGQLLRVSVRVDNAGAAEADGFVVRLYDGEPAPERALGEATVDALAPGASATVEIPWDTLAPDLSTVAGRHVLHAVADADEVLLESDEGNNGGVFAIDLASPSRPDPAVESFAVDPDRVESGKNVLFQATVINRGLTAPAGVEAAFSVNRAEVGRVSSPASLATGERVAFDLPVSTTGRQGLLEAGVEVDPDDRIDEGNETNNRATTGLQVDGAAVTLALGTDRLSYAPDETVAIQVTADNAGAAAFDGVLRLAIVDSAGVEIATVTDDAVSLAPGSTSLAFTWATGTSLPGSYTAVARLTAAGAPVAEGQVLFSIARQVNVGARVFADRDLYPPTGTAVLTGRVTSASANTILQDLSFRVAVADAAGSEVFATERSVPVLYPGSDVPLEALWEIGGAAPGAYTATLSVRNAGGLLLAFASASLAVEDSAETGAGLSGALTVTPEVVGAGAPVRFDYRADNGGNADLEDVELRVDLVRLADGTGAGSIAIRRSVAVGAEVTGSFGLPTLGLPPGDYLAELVAAFPGAEVRLDRAALTIGPGVSVGDASAPEGDAGAATLSFAVTLSEPSDAEVSVSYATADGTAVAGEDYEPASGLVTFAPGETSKRVPVTVLGDLVGEVDEVMLLTLSDPVGVLLGDAQALGTLRDEEGCASPNLLADPGAEEGSVDDPVPGWQTANPAVWSRRFAEPTPLDGAASFSASGEAATTELFQEIDLSPLAGRIDAGGQLFQVEGFLRTGAAPDTGRVVLELLDATGAVLDTFDSGAIASPSGWQAVQGVATPPAGTRAARLHLSAASGDGSSLDVSFDRLGLRSVGTPVWSVGDVELLEGDGGSVPALFPVTLSCAQSAVVALDWASTDGTATAGADYQGSSGQVILAAGETAGTIEVPVLGDTVDEDDEEFAVELSGGGEPGAPVVLRPRAVARVIDDDGPATLSVLDSQVPEGDDPGDVLVTVSLSGVSGKRVSAAWSTAEAATGDAATAGEDFTAASGTVTLDPGTTEGTIRVPLPGDRVNEPDETFLVRLSSPSAAVLGKAEATVTLRDDDPVLLSVGDLSVVEGDAGTTEGRFPVTLSVPSVFEIAVSWSTSDLDALAGVDYQASSGTLTFAPGATRADAVVPVLGDTLREPVESFLVTLSAPSSAGGSASLADPEAVGSIVDDDGILVSVADVTVREGAGAEALFEVSLNKPVSAGVSVSYATVESTATAGTDYEAISGSITIPAGASAVDISVPLVDDGIFEPAETFSVELANPSGDAILLDAVGEATVLDDDGWALNGAASDLDIPGCFVLTPAINFQRGSVWRQASTELGSSFDKTFRVYLGSKDSGSDGLVFVLQSAGLSALGDAGGYLGYRGVSPSIGVEIDTYRNSWDPTFDHLAVDLDGTIDHRGHPAVQALASSENIEDGEEHELRVVWNAPAATLDVHLDGDERLLFTRDVGSEVFQGADVYWGFSAGTGSVNNLQYFCPTASCDGSAGEPLISIGDVAVVEGDVGTVQAHFPVTLSCPTDHPVTVAYGTADGTAVGGEDYLPASGSLTFQPGETSRDVVVGVVGDLDAEPDETFVLGLSAPLGGTVRYRRGTGTIFSDDVAITARDLHQAEGDVTGTTVAIPLILEAPAAETIRVDYATADGTATAGSDYGAVTGSVSFAPGETEKEIMIPWIGDLLDEGDEQFFLELSTTSERARIANPRPAVTILDDDRCPQGNLLVNGSADEPLADGEISGWTEATGSSWTQRTHSPAPLDGPAYFFPGAVSQAELRQDVDVSGLAAFIDRAAQRFELSGAVRSYNQGNPDTAQVVVEYRDADGALLASYDSGVQASRTSWRAVSDVRTAPAGTRTIRVRLMAQRHSGSNNDGYFDALVLRALDRPSFVVDDVELPEGETGTSDALFTIGLSCSASAAASIDYLTADGTATAGSDYLPASGTVTLEPGQLAVQVPVAVLGDTQYEDAETFSLRLVNPSGAGLVDGEGVATILPDEVFASVADTSVVEGSAGTTEAVFTIALSGASPLPVTLSYATRDASATAGEDYEATAGTLTFAPGETEHTVTVAVLGDGRAEGDETFDLVLSDPINASLQVADAVCTVIDDDVAISIADAAVVEGSAGLAEARFPVSLAAAASDTVTVDFATREVLATEGVDYLPVSGTLTFAPGQVEAFVRVEIVGDEEVEPSETFEVVLSNPVGGGILDGEATGSIVDDDNCPGPNLLENPGAEEPLVDGEIRGWVEAAGSGWTVRTAAPGAFSGEAAFDAGTAPEGELRQDVDLSAYAERIDRGIQPFVFEGFVRSVAESPADTERVVVEYRDADNAQVLDSFDSGDLQSTDGWRQVAAMRTVPAGTRWVRVRLLARRTSTDGHTDALFDALALRSLATPVLGVGQAVITEGDTGSHLLEVPVSLNCAAEETVTASYATYDRSALAGIDYLSSSGAVTLAPGETDTTVPVEVLGDTELELEERFDLVLDNPSGAVVVDPVGSGLIRDDDNSGAATKELRTFWIKDLRIFAWADDTEITLVDIDTGLPLSMNDSRISSTNVSANPFVLERAGDSFEGIVRGNIRVRVAASDPSGANQLKPITVWTGRLSSGLRHPAQPPTGNPWASYIPAFNIRPRANGRELGDRFLGFTSRELTLFVRKGAEPTQISVEDLANNVDLDSDDSSLLGPEDAAFANDEIEIYYLDGFEDDTVRISSNAELSVLAGLATREAPDWTVSPPSYAAGDDGIELGTEFYTFAHRSLTVFPVEDDTTVTITDLSDGDDSQTFTLAEGDTSGPYELFTPVLDTRTGSGIVARESDPAVTILSTGNAFDDDYVKVESDKPVLVYVGPAGSDVNEFGDVAFSVPTGPESRIIYCFAQDGGGQRDLQIFGLTDDTRVEITSLSYTAGFNASRHHDFVIGPGVGGSTGWLTGQPGQEVWWGTGVWAGEMLRIESNHPVVVINGDYDNPHFGAFIPFLVDSLSLPPVADAGLELAATVGETVTLDGTGSFDQDDLTGTLAPRFEWDLDLAVDTDGDGDPADDVDATGPTPQQIYLVAGVHAAELTYFDDEGESDTDQVRITVAPHPLSLTKVADVSAVAPGGEIGYELTVTNGGDGPVDQVVLRDVIPQHASLTGTVTTNQGAVVGTSPIEIDLGTLAPEASVEVSFRVTVDVPLDGAVEAIENRATVQAAGLPPLPSDDPSTPEPFDPTVTPVEGSPVDLHPTLVAAKTDSLAFDADGDGVPSPGDEIAYTIEITNAGGAPATDVTLTDLVPENASLVPGSLETSAGTVVGESPVEVSLGELPAGAVATVTFRVAVDLPLPAGVDRITNQGTVTSAELPAVLTDDPDLGGDADPTETILTAAPELVAEKTDRLALDADGDGAVSPGDEVEYTVTVRNVGNTAAIGVGLADPVPDHAAIVPGSVSASEGTVDQEAPSVVVSLGEIAGGADVTVRFRVTVENPIAAGVRELSNQGLVASAELPDVVTDDPEVDGAADPTVTPVVAAPELLVEKGDTLFEDVGGDGLASPGDVVLYRITVENVGNTAATDVVLTDAIPEHTVLEPGTLQASGGTVRSDDPAAIEVGQLDVGEEVVVTFRVRIDDPFPLDVLEVSNQAEVASAELGPVLSDDPDDPDGAGEADPTVTEVFITPEVAVDDVTVSETAGPAIFSLTLSAASNRPVKVPFTTGDGPGGSGGSGTSPATAGLDYLAASGTVVFAPGETTRTVPVEILDDALDELDETFTLSLGEVEGGVVADGSGLGTIVDDDPPPFVSIGDATVVEGDPPGTGSTGSSTGSGAAELVFPVTLSDPSGLGVGIDYATAPVTVGRPAEAGVDYQPVSGTLSFPPGVVSASIRVPVTPDLLDELDETLRVVLSNPVAVVPADAEAVGTIVDDDEALVSVDDLAVEEGDAGTADALVPVRLSLAADREIRVDFATVAGTATEGSDYLPVSGTLTFAVGATESRVAVPVVGDLLLEPLEETLTVELSGASDGGGTAAIGIDDGEGTLTILDDERCPGPNLLANPGAELHPEGGALPDWSEIAGTDWQRRFADPEPAEGTAYFAAGAVDFGELAQDVSVRAYQVRIEAGIDGAPGQRFAFTGKVRTFHESPPDTARIVIEYRDRTNAVVLDSFDSGEIVSPDVWREVSDERTAPAGTGWIRVRLIATRFSGTTDDGYFDALELRSLRAATLTVDDVTVYEGDPGTTTEARFGVHLACPLPTEVSTSYVTADGTATAGEDYLAADGTVVFQPGEIDQSVPVTVLGDDVHEPHETFFLDLAGVTRPAGGEGVVLLDPRGEGLIVNDDFCARSPGFWKTHGELWPTDWLVLGEVEYDVAGLLDLLDYHGPDASTHLARQLVATRLNLLVGSDPDIRPVVEDADAFLAAFPPGSNPQKDDKKAANAIKDLLDAYNNPSCQETPVVPASSGS